MSVRHVHLPLNQEVTAIGGHFSIVEPIATPSAQEQIRRLLTDKERVHQVIFQ